MTGWTVRAGGVVLIGLALAGAGGPLLAEDLDRRVERLENIVDSGQLVELLQRLGRLEDEIRQLRGDIEGQNHQLRQLQERQRNLYSDLDERLREVELSVDRGVPAVAADTPATVEQAAEPPATAAAGSEREEYEEAFNLLRGGQYESAATAFTQFVRRHPDSAYAANAQYWLAESRYVTRDFDQALDAFLRVIEDYPDSNKIADAKLKIGYTRYEMGRYDEARSILQEVRQEFPDTTVARLAEDRLARMRDEGH